MMNLHPILVHFPIALLSIYSVFELLRFKKLLAQSFWLYVKAILVILGAGAAALAVLAGDSAKHALQKGEIHSPLAEPFRVVRMHENYGHTAAIIYLLIATLYLVSLISEFNFERFLPEALLGVWNIIQNIQRWFFESGFIVLVAVIGLACLLITGALGGALVYGSNVDPFVRTIYTLLHP